LQTPSTILLATVLLTISGAFAPGPLSFSAIIVGGRSGVLGGIFIALGHMLFELPYVLALLWFEENVVKAIEAAKQVMVVVAAAFIFYFAYLTAKTATFEGVNSVTESRLGRLLRMHPILVGFVLTAFNPYFLLWWVSVGYPIVTAMASNLPLVPLIYTAHVSLDYLWLGLLAFLGGSSARLLSSKAYGYFMRLLALVLALFGVDLLARTFLGVPLLPF